MPFCTECGAENPRENKFCSECGTRLPVIEAPAPPDIFAEAEEPAPVAEAAPEPPVQPAPDYTPPQSFQATFTQETPQYAAPVATGGLLAWSIVTILLCLIPGIVALVQTLGINKCATAEEQKKKMDSARLWCIIGTALGAISIITRLASGG